MKNKNFQCPPDVHSLEMEQVRMNIFGEYITSFQCPSNSHSFHISQIFYVFLSINQVLS